MNISGNQQKRTKEYRIYIYYEVCFYFWTENVD